LLSAFREKAFSFHTPYNERKIMNTERLLLDTDSMGNLKGLPKFPPNKQVEVLFLVIDKSNPPQRRQPHRDIAGKLQINGDIFDAASETDWNVYQKKFNSQG